MKWNWQQADWPNFTYDKAQLASFDALFLQHTGILIGSIKHLDSAAHEQLSIELMSNEAIKTSEIEGEILNRASVQSSIRHQFGLEKNSQNASPAEQGIAAMMVDLYRSYQIPLSHETLFQWHRMVTKGRHDLKDIGCYRTHLEPMQIVSGLAHKPTIHFEAPPSKVVPAHMKKFIAWFNDTAPQGKSPLPALIRAGIAHLYFITVHPFEDGNGRIGRAIAEKALAESLGQSTLIALADTILKHRKDYYAALHQTNKSNEITPWLKWFAETVIEAIAYTQKCVEFLIEKTKFFDRFRGHLNARQEKVLLRLFREGPEGFIGGLSAEKYISITKTSRATATRDLHDLVKKGALTKAGERKKTRYYLTTHQ